VARYEVTILPGAVRQIKKLPPEAKRLVQAGIELLADNPRPPQAKKLSGVPGWRVSLGDYRIIYRVRESVLTIVVVAVGHCREIYRR
jgi:mRNA interferase RelE/StbE